MALIVQPDAKLAGAVRLLAEKLGVTPDELGDVTIVIEDGTVTVNRPPAADVPEMDDDD